ncbi:hypothetical protein E2C01_097087 [Portunus trituberculatus]|uniref:Uncharacterized protein n=1 Tax=Portunus trituberculatus TaxID=210409 RepID=A0A5B7JZI3_PORTR|nr:hypothetical protein [Portunus trituberculatus]
MNCGSEDFEEKTTVGGRPVPPGLVEESLIGRVLTTETTSRVVLSHRGNSGGPFRSASAGVPRMPGVPPSSALNANGV